MRTWEPSKCHYRWITRATARNIITPWIDKVLFLINKTINKEIRELLLSKLRPLIDKEVTSLGEVVLQTRKIGNWEMDRVQVPFKITTLKVLKLFELREILKNEKKKTMRLIKTIWLTRWFWGPEKSWLTTCHLLKRIVREDQKNRMNMLLKISSTMCQNMTLIEDMWICRQFTRPTS